MFFFFSSQLHFGSQGFFFSQFHCQKGEFGEGVDFARGVAAIVVCCRNSSCNSSCDARVRNGRKTIAFFLLFRVQQFVCNSSCEGMFQRRFECGRQGKYCSCTPCRFHPFSSKHPSQKWMFNSDCVNWIRNSFRFAWGFALSALLTRFSVRKKVSLRIRTATNLTRIAAN